MGVQFASNILCYSKSFEYTLLCMQVTSSKYIRLKWERISQDIMALIVQDNTAGQRQDQPAAAPPAAQVCISSSSLRFICCQLSTALLLVSPILAPLLILLACFIRLHHFLSAF